MTQSETNSPRWLLYGANGYTGELIARAAVAQGSKPILAGRSTSRIQALAKELACESRVFALENQTATVIALQDVALVLNCAGPFSSTAGRMMQACLASHVHYLDITGEIDVFELAHRLSEKAERANVLLCPGVGFDVVPTDCLAAKLKNALPDATHLTLAFEGQGRASVGTAKTGIESLHAGGRIRKDGILLNEPLGHRMRRLDLGNGEREVAGIPWGDVSTAYYTTGIPNIEVFIAGPPGSALRMKKAWRWRSLLRTGVAQWVLKKAVARGPRGPSEAERNNNPTFIWGEVSNAAGVKKTGRLRTANGYAVTVQSALAIVARVLGAPTAAGYTTPARLMGAEFVETLHGSSKIKIE
ncbi:MAG: saccharopine dehydrogenase NADP-binding domain-containing protein [Candidatus Obscuribacterales bacterium]|nr:saccharopine dehydrogenase NADP-binding domain-containing protein [Steroidobacteraceae bacterium]